jgi:long-chain acyl-CoA synthetase
MSLNLAIVAREGAKRGETIAIRDGDRALSYGDLDAQARGFAAGLTSLGVGRGDHVALFLPNVYEFTVAYFGCHYAGAPVVPLNVMLKGEEIAYHLEDAQAKALVAHHSLLEAARDGLGRTPRRCSLVEVGGAESSFEALTATRPVTELPDTRPDDTAVLLYTSGTTGRPKGAELTHFNLFFNAEIAGRLHRVDAETRALAVLPLFHSFGQTVIQNATLLAGGRIVLLPRFEARSAFETIARERITFFAGVPTMYFALLHDADAARYDMSSLEVCVSGGAPMPVEVMRAFDERYRVNIVEGYGLSETSPLASLNHLDRPKKPGSIGTPVWGCEFKLVDERGETVTEPGAVGEICIKGVNIMKGYFQRPDATREAIRDGWFKTGDLATRDADGYYFIVDRKKDMILRGGFNVYPREVEEVLYRHAAVAEAAVIGIPDQRVGEEVKAVVALKPGSEASADELIAFCREHLAAFKCPRAIDFVAALPKGPTGKILRRELRKPPA